MRMGSETEFGIAHGWALDKAQTVLNRLITTQPCLPAVKGGFFLPNGARVYVDQGKQNEYATPEVESPDALVAHELAGRQLVEKAAADCKLILLCSNVDPCYGSTWGTHENYECCRAPSSLDLAHLSVHLATRIIYTGAGGIDPRRRECVPVLSPRACRIVACLSHQGVARKSLVFQKPSNYGPGYRLHVFSGESLLSHTASYLKYATTALVTMALDAKHPMPWPIPTAPPLRLLRWINRDLSLSRRIPLADGRRLTAIEIQRVILDGLARQVTYLPDWAPTALQRWSETLDALTVDSPAIRQQIDWLLMTDLLNELLEDAHPVPNAPVDGPGGQRANLSRCDCHPAHRGTFAGLRSAASELYIRLHMLGEHSLHDQLSQMRRINHRVEEITPERILAAMSTPPPGRATLRAELVRQARIRPGATLSWESLMDYRHARSVMIPDRELPGWDQAWFDVVPSISEEVAAGDFRQGYYKAVIDTMIPQLGNLIARSSCDAIGSACLSCARAGLIGPLAETREAYGRSGAKPLNVITLDLICGINQGLAPPLEPLQQLIRLGDQLADAERVGSYVRLEFLQSKAWFLFALGAYEEASTLIEKIIAEEKDGSRVRMLARSRCYAGELSRRQGRYDQARRYAEAALHTHRSGWMMGDMAMHSLPLLARLADNDAEARDHLSEALHYADVTENELAKARLLCTKARRLRDTSDRDAITTLFSRVPTLISCPVAARLQSEWDTWSKGSIDPRADDYWGLA